MRRGLVALGLGVAAAAAVDDVVRDALLDRSLAELLAYPANQPDAIDASIRHTLAECRRRGIAGVLRSVATTEARENDDDDVMFCHRVRFVRHARQRHREREIVLYKRQDESPLTTTIQVRRGEDVDYQTFFETFAERHVPLVLTDVPSLVDDMEAFAHACFAPYERQATLRRTDNACASWLEQFRVPLITVNNFIPRTNVSTTAPFLLTLLRVSETSVIHTCPFGLHSVFVPIHGSVEISLYDAQLQPFMIPPDVVTSKTTEVGVAVDGATSRSMEAFSGVESHNLEAADAAFSDVLHPYQTLFVPGGKYIAAFQGSSSALRFCFVDASNLNVVTETLRVDALVSSIAKRLFLSLQSPTFDSSMMRRPSPSDTLWPNSLQWPKEAKLLKRRDMVSSDTDVPVPMSRRERLKLWHEDKRWERRIASLTLPVPMPPIVMNATRTTVTLRWQDLYERPKNDITEFGYEVHWRREDHAIRDGDGDTIATEGAVNFTHTELVRSAMPTTLFGDEFDGKDIEGVVRGLVADATYWFSVRMYVGDTFGVESERSHSAQTAPCSVPEPVPGVVSIGQASGTCVDVRWLATSDDGGRRITSYVFAFRYVDTPLGSLQEADSKTERWSVLRLSSADAKTVKPHAWLSGTICDQIPGRVQVRVAAVNAIGTSVWSKRSTPTVMTSANQSDTPVEIPTVLGYGDPGFVSPPDRHTTVTTTQPRPRVILSDVQQQVVVARPNTTVDARYDVWAGHHSPQRFHVSSELVLADPLDASQPLRNAIEVRDRVVVVARGNVPFLFKLRHAQAAGALGVIVMDVSGRCARGFDQSCVPGATKRFGEGFGASDQHPLWQDIRIPFVLALPETSSALLDLLR